MGLVEVVCRTAEELEDSLSPLVVAASVAPSSWTQEVVVRIHHSDQGDEVASFPVDFLHQEVADAYTSLVVVCPHVQEEVHMVDKVPVATYTIQVHLEASSST